MINSLSPLVPPEIPQAATVVTAASEPPRDAYNPYSAILAELAERERDTVIGAPGQSGVFEFLCQLTPADAADFLRNEHPQTIALVATGLPTGRAAEMLHALPEALRWDVTQHISRLEPPAPEVCREVAKNLSVRLQERQSKVHEQSLAKEPAKVSRPGRFTRRQPYGMSIHRQPVAATPRVLHAAEGLPATSSSMSMQQLDLPAAAPQVAVIHDTGPVTFEDLCVLDRMAFAAVLRVVDARSFAIALFDRSDPFKQKFLSLVPRTLAAAVLQQTRALGPLRLSDIAASQVAISSVIWSLANQGAIKLPPHLIRRK